MGATVAIIKERRSGETRVAATPDSVKKLAGLGLSVALESGAGTAAAYPDADYAAAGATIAPSAEAALAGAGLGVSQGLGRGGAHGEDDVGASEGGRGARRVCPLRPSPGPAVGAGGQRSPARCAARLRRQALTPDQGSGRGATRSRRSR